MAPSAADLSEQDRLKGRILALQAKTLANGCSQEEALSAAAKVAELLDRYDLSLSDIEIRNETCESASFDTRRKRRNSLEGCVNAVADFCDCRVWRETGETGAHHYVFFGLKQDTAVAIYLCGVIDGAMQLELARFKATKDYLRYHRRDRTLASNSFLYGMAASISDRLLVMKAERDRVNLGTGRDLVVTKRDVIAEELSRLGLNFRTSQRGHRMIVGHAHDAGSKAGAGFTIVTALRDAAQD